MKNTLEFTSPILTSSFSNRNVVVKVAESKTELEDIFRLRYKIYVEQMHWDANCADHERKRIEEPLDKRAYNIGVWVNGRLVACIRFHLGDRSEFGIYQDRFHMADIENACLAQSAVCSKLMVDVPFRSSRIHVLLQQFCYRIGLENNMLYCFIESRDELVPYYKKFGFQPYMDRIPHPECGESTPLLLKVQDIAYLQSIHSPFAAIYDEVSETRVLSNNAA